jgi:predicted AAA+ superfamily ATPase
VSLTGPRQVGKTTLLEAFCTGGRKYISFEDPVIASAAREDPDLWLEANPPPIGLDEVQRVPEIFPAIKRVVDREKKPGLFFLTGSALWLSMKRVRESLAGRVALLELWPFRRAEWEGRPSLEIRRLFTEPIEGIVKDREVPSGLGWISEAIFQGGYPVPAGMSEGPARKLWFESYVRTYLERDVSDLARIENLAGYRRILLTLLGRTGQLLNVSGLSRDVGVSQPTTLRYTEWLRTTYQCFLVEPYFSNIEKSLVKTPKLFWTDTGMVTALLGLQDWQQAQDHGLDGRLLETWVAGEFQKDRASRVGGAFRFFRVHNGPEVDFVLDLGGGKVGALEVKAAMKIEQRDLAGLGLLRSRLKGRFRRGIVLYPGKEIAPLGNDLFAVPLGVLA